jgi:WG containing repeat
MKTKLNILLILISLSAFAQEASKHYDKIGGFRDGVAIVWLNGHCGAISQSGKEIIPPVYTKISDFGRDAIAYTTKDGLIGLITITGKVIVPNVYTYIGPFHGFRAITRKNGLAGMINKDGKVIVENKYEDIKIDGHGAVRAIDKGKEVILDVKD